MDANQYYIFIVLIIASVAGFTIYNYSWEVSNPPIVDTVLHREGGIELCDNLYEEIEKGLDEANYCQTDSDCDVIMLGGWYIQFGCYHFVNKEVDRQKFRDKMAVYNEKCGRVINRCSPTPESSCVSGRCVTSEKSSCESRGGNLTVDANGIERCYLPTSDAGERCTDNGQCEVFCVVFEKSSTHGRCSPEIPFSGCALTIDRGKINEVCK